MKVQQEPVDSIKDALVAFFDREGGYQAVAKTVEINPQQLYYIISGRNEPTLKTVVRILRHYPKEVELRKAMSLPSADMGSQAPPDASLEKKYHELERRYSVLEQKYETLMERYGNIVDSMAHRITASFPTANSETHVDSFDSIYQQYTRIGFKQAYQMIADAKKQTAVHTVSVKTIPVRVATVDALPVRRSASKSIKRIRYTVAQPRNLVLVKK